MTRMRCCLTVLAIVCAGCASSGPQRGMRQAPDGAWLAFRGSGSRQGVARSGGPIPPLRVAWTYEPQGPGNGFMDWGPVASGGIVYTPNGLNRVVALDAITGAVVWEVPLDSNVFSVSLSPDARQLLVTTAITAGPSPTLFAMDPSTGAVRWHNQANGQQAVGGIESAPVVDARTVYVGSLRYAGRGGVSAYDLARGTLRWQWMQSGASAITPLALAGGRLYVGLDNRRVYCLDARTGRPQWEVAFDEGLGFSAPVADGTRVLVAWDRQVLALDARRGTVLWRRTLSASADVSSPAVHEGVLYVGTKDGRLTALRAADGESLWSRPLGAGALSTSPVIDASARQLWVATADNVVLAVALATGEVADRFALPRSAGLGCWRNSPALFQGRLFIGSLDRRLYALMAAWD